MTKRALSPTELTCPKCGKTITVFVPFISVHCACGGKIKNTEYQAQQTTERKRGRITRVVKIEGQATKGDD